MLDSSFQWMIDQVAIILKVLKTLIIQWVDFIIVWKIKVFVPVLSESCELIKYCIG